MPHLFFGVYLWASFSHSIKALGGWFSYLSYPNKKLTKELNTWDFPCLDMPKVHCSYLSLERVAFPSKVFLSFYCDLPLCTHGFYKLCLLQQNKAVSLLKGFFKLSFQSMPCPTRQSFPCWLGCGFLKVFVFCLKPKTRPVLLKKWASYCWLEHFALV